MKTLAPPPKVSTWIFYFNQQLINLTIASSAQLELRYESLKPRRLHQNWRVTIYLFAQEILASTSGTIKNTPGIASTIFSLPLTPWNDPILISSSWPSSKPGAHHLHFGQTHFQSLPHFFPLEITFSKGADRALHFYRVWMERDDKFGQITRPRRALFAKSFGLCLPGALRLRPRRAGMEIENTTMVYVFTGQVSRLVELINAEWKPEISHLWEISLFPLLSCCITSRFTLHLA